MRRRTPDGTALPAYTPGAHVDVLLDEASGLVRQYSLCGPLDGGRYRLAVLKALDSRGGSRAMHALRAGDRLRISAPRNRFGLATARRHLLFAGGIGITPLLAMACHLDAAGGDYTLHYCARSRTDAAFAPELADHPRVVLHFDNGDPSQLLDVGQALGAPDRHTAVYVCGPGGFMDHVLNTAETMGWPPAALRKERFAVGAPDPGSAEPGSFIVRLASTRAEYHVPADRSALDVLLDNGVDAPSSCRQGICGECVVRVLAGEPDHRDDVLTPDEQAEGLFAPCASRARSQVLELDL
ncbi:oxidoreductase [Streptomyces sp. ISL-96]|uniref:PDR/VanB family oxidoreductase n=1 Tax=Streptomyces sp. ISL-96 TaxID=2819191 RepID=UPI001BEA9948|nr:PDR/VanB family oxidoreductase [Streptomyces sp. ISL-96]MBT2493836.1 oxidoreductase [Streptomyces sp. ISL-96]